MSAPGLKSSAFRLVGMLLNLVVVILAIAGNFAYFTGSEYVLSNIAILIGIILIIFYLKFDLILDAFKKESDFVDDNKTALMMGTYFGFLVLAWIGLFVGHPFYESSFWLAFIYPIQMLFPFFWHFSLSIYKNEKKQFIAIFVSLEVYFTVYAIISNLDPTNWYLIIIQIIAAIAVAMILIIEYMMKQKKLLNYI